MSEGWQTTKLGEISEVLTGPFGSLLHKSDYITDGIPLINPVNIVDGRISVGTEKTVSNKTIERLRNYVLSEGDIVFGRRGEIGRCAVVGREQSGWLCGTGCFFIRRSAKADSRFLAELLGAPPYRQRLELAATGTTMKNLNNQALQNLSISIPSLSEQQRIVAILDETFAGLATATANAEKNLKNARELFDSHLSQAFAKVTETCAARRLGDIVSRLTNGYVGPTRNIYLENGVPYLLARHVRNNHLEFDGKTFVSNGFNEKHKKSKLKMGDVLLVQSGHIGHSAVVGTDHEGHNCHAMIVISPIAEQLSGEFLSFYFGSSLMKRKFEEIRSGSTVPHLTCGLVKELMIPLPDIQQQRSLIAVFREVEQETDKLMSLTNAKLFALGELKQSILQKAFSGELASPPSDAIREAAE